MVIISGVPIFRIFTVHNYISGTTSHAKFSLHWSVIIIHYKMIFAILSMAEEGVFLRISVMNLPLVVCNSVTLHCSYKLIMIKIAS